MAKKNMNIYDFLNKEYGIVASAESVLINTGSKSVTSAEYRKPVNAFALAESLSFIMADPYKQHAQAVTLTAAGESVARGYGELSASELKDKVVDGAKDAWKSFLALIDKLIEVIKQFIRGLFDKEKKLGDVSNKLKLMLKRNIGDSSKIDTEKTLQIAFVDPALFGFIPTDDEGKLNMNEYRSVLKRISSSNTSRGTIANATSTQTYSRMQSILAKFLNSGVHINNARSDASTLPIFLVQVYRLADSIAGKSADFSGSSVAGVRSLAKRSYNVGNTSDSATYSERDSDGTQSVSGDGIENIPVDKYKEDWNTLIEFFEDNAKEIKRQLKTKSKGDINRTETNEIEGILIDNMNKSRGDAGVLESLLAWYKKVVDSLKMLKINKKLEDLIKGLGRLKRAIIKNKENDYGNKLAQLGRVAVNKFTILITKTISLNNTVYATLFKAIAINLKSAQLISAKSTRRNNNNDINQDDIDNKYQ
nr:MAG TPA: hypothetical protein [Caudoviricetes sp.]